jgi:hypothetical protein
MVRGLTLFDNLAKASLDSFTKAGGTKHVFAMANALAEQADASTACTVLSIVDRVSKSEVWAHGRAFVAG